MQINSLDTEKRNKNTLNIDIASSLEIVQLINNEDASVALTIKNILPDIAAAVDIIYKKLMSGGRLIYLGAGTSGRLGVLDASECPPTYGTSPDLVQALIAGGKAAMFTAQEGAEDSELLAVKDLQTIAFSSADVLVGIAASGRTPYVLGGLNYAKQMSASTIALVCTANSLASKIADLTLAPVTGPEAVTGSTRMKAGTAQKMILNMLTTATMIRLGKVYSNLMVDLKATNAKLQQRSLNILLECTEASEESCRKALSNADGNVKTALLMLLANCNALEAK